MVVVFSPWFNKGTSVSRRGVNATRKHACWCCSCRLHEQKTTCRLAMHGPRSLVFCKDLVFLDSQLLHYLKPFIHSCTWRAVLLTAVSRSRQAQLKTSSGGMPGASCGSRCISYTITSGLPIMHDRRSSLINLVFWTVVSVGGTHYALRKSKVQ